MKKRRKPMYVKKQILNIDQQGFGISVTEVYYPERLNKPTD
jgi:hypothetical protein